MPFESLNENTDYDSCDLVDTPMVGEIQNCMRIKKGKQKILTLSWYDRTLLYHTARYRPDLQFAICKWPGFFDCSKTYADADACLVVKITLRSTSGSMQLCVIELVSFGLSKKVKKRCISNTEAE
ncbi:hypothetical protein Tco_0975562 [Tanacetum coccineum]|uniref:Uncharacterized protein n=1 Tax=Tanacetum coccineum TaxID=301880 RepID=A0ABQ5EER0_9ASTR